MRAGEGTAKLWAGYALWLAMQTKRNKTKATHRKQSQPSYCNCSDYPLHWF